MKTTRRDFIRNASMISALIGGSSLQAWSSHDLLAARSKVKLRFIIASDAHYGQPNTPFDAMSDTFIEKAKGFHQAQACDFCVLNGDLIHDDPSLMPKVKAKFDTLSMPYYVTRGNHDRVNANTWQTIWDMPLNLSFKKGNTAFILADSSNEKGEYVSPDLIWLKNELENYKKLKNIILVVHIPQAKFTKNAIDTPAFFELVKSYANIRAVFHGHEHDQDGIHMHDGIPYIFDAHIGGNWGTAYKGFRVVELMKDNSLVTYMMNPDVALKKEVLKG